MGEVAHQQEDEMRALSIDLLREWWLTVTQALVDDAGSEVALRYLKPYFINEGIAGAHHMEDIFGKNPENPGDAAAMWLGVCQTLINGGTAQIWTNGKDAAISETTHCPIANACKEACICLGVYIGENGGSELVPGYYCKQIASLWDGDSSCKWKIVKEGSASVPQCDIPVPIPSITPELRNHLRLEYYGESWTSATKAYVDYAGNEKARQRLAFYMRHSGLSFGTRLAKQLDLREPDASSLGEIISHFNVIHQKKGMIEMGKDISHGTVTECPFSDVPMEICLQFEAFYNGICESIDPNYEFTYDRKMTMGDKNCNWTIKRKKGSLKTSVRDEPLEPDPLKILKLRFARGEISKEDYLEMRSLLE